MAAAAFRAPVGLLPPYIVAERVSAHIGQKTFAFDRFDYRPTTRPTIAGCVPKWIGWAARQEGKSFWGGMKHALISATSHGNGSNC